jgi:hypothetical protein
MVSRQQNGKIQRFIFMNGRKNWKESMRQKFVISREGPGHQLNIKEYAVIEAKVKKPVASMAENRKLTLYCEETYENKVILSSLSNGLKAMVESLRTRNFYPIEPYAAQIAESVIKLFESSTNGPVELIFDDLDLVTPEMIAA